ncbi:MAG: hypothetical protein K2N72_07680 [Oscillospiraceae bacterium]|nr:hypothetical protein [Oscillospiraceae bacterium]
MSKDKAPKSRLPFKYVWVTLMESVIIAAVIFMGVSLFCAFSHTSKTASALIYFTDSAETINTDNYGIDYTARKVSLLRQASLSAEALENAVKDTSLSVTMLTDYLTVDRLGNSDGAVITLTGLDSPGEAPIILGKLINYLEKNFEGGEFRVISYCDPENEPALPFTAIALCIGIISGSVYFKAAYTVREKRIRKKQRAKRSRNAEKNRRKGAPQPVPGKRYIETAMIKAQSLGTADSAAPHGLEKSGYTHAAKVLAEHAVTGGGCAVIAVCAAHKPEGRPEAGHTPRAVPIDGTFAAYLSCALAEQGCRTALIECDLKNPVIGKIFRKTGKGGLVDMAAGSCTVWDILVPNARKGVDIICDKKAYPAPPAVFSASCFGGLLNYLSSQYDVILLHAPKGWSCPEWDLIYRFCTGVVAVAEEGKKPDKTCAMGILDSKSRFTGLACVRDLLPESAPEQKEAPVKNTPFRKAAGNSAAKKAFGFNSRAKKSPAKKPEAVPTPKPPEPKRDVVLVKVPGAREH